ncbi:hypothetical protein KC357_g266 [Hortaea werneckii]|nr:hypothetical protein KC357_g266 [Hortaea werneckii]
MRFEAIGVVHRHLLLLSLRTMASLSDVTSTHMVLSIWITIKIRRILFIIGELSANPLLCRLRRRELVLRMRCRVVGALYLGPLVELVPHLLRLHRPAFSADTADDLMIVLDTPGFARRREAGRLTHSSMSLRGTDMSLVRTERGAVSFGVFDLSSLDFLSFLVRVAGDFETRLLVLKGESCWIAVLVDCELSMVREHGDHEADLRRCLGLSNLLGTEEIAPSRLRWRCAVRQRQGRNSPHAKDLADERFVWSSSSLSLGGEPKVVSGNSGQDGSACLVSHCIGLLPMPVHMHERQKGQRQKTPIAAFPLLDCKHALTSAALSRWQG